MTVQALKGQKVETNSNEYNNGKKVVPTFLCDIKVVTKDNYEELLIDYGYYTATDLI